MATYSLSPAASTANLHARGRLTAWPVDGDVNPLLNGQLTVKVGTHDFTPYILPGLRCTTTNPGGFGECSFQIASSSPFAAFTALGHTMAKGDAVEVAHNGTVLFQGELTSDLSHAVVEGGCAYYDCVAAGLWWKAGLRGDYCQTWADDDYGQWFEFETNGPFTVDTDGKLDIRLEAQQTAKNGAAKSLYYWLDSGMGDSSAEIYDMFGEVAGNVSDKDTAQWHADISYSDSPWGTWTVGTSWSNTTIAAGTKFLYGPPARQRALRLRLYVDNATSSGTTADRYIRITKLSVVTSDNASQQVISTVNTGNPGQVDTGSDHGLKTGDRVYIHNVTTSASIAGWQTITYVNSHVFSVPVNVTSYTPGSPGTERVIVCRRLDDAMSDIAESTGLATSSDLQTGGIGNLNWGLNIRPHMTRADAIDYLAGTHSAPIDYGFWDGAAFYCQERATPGASADYLIDSTDPGIDFNVYKAVEACPDAVKVLYLQRDETGVSVYPDGTLLSVYRPSLPTWTDASEVVAVWEDWADMMLTETQAQNIGDQILDWYDANAYQGTITIATPTVPLRAGGTKTTAYIRAGEYIADSNLETALGTTTRLMITGTELDVDNGIMTLTIGEDRKDFVARIVAANWSTPTHKERLGAATKRRPRPRYRRR